MSHSVLNLGYSIPIFVVELTIVNYTAGGETVLQSEVDGSLAGKQLGIVFSLCPPAQNSLAAVLMPVLNAGKIQLFRLSTQLEIPTTNALNASIIAIVTPLN